MSKLSENYLKITGVTLMAVLALGIGGTGAAVRHRMALKNEVRTPTVQVTTDEKTGSVHNGTKQKEVVFRNEGSADIFLRIAYAETWIYTEKSSDGKAEEILLPNRSETGGDDSIVAKDWYNWDANWYDGGDGWYYYKKILEAGEETDEILRSVTFKGTDSYPDSRYADAEYRLHFQVEAVQASDELQVSKDAVKELFDKSISVDSENSWPGNKYTTTVRWEGGN